MAHNAVKMLLKEFKIAKNENLIQNQYCLSPFVLSWDIFAMEDSMTAIVKSSVDS